MRLGAGGDAAVELDGVRLAATVVRGTATHHRHRSPTRPAGSSLRRSAAPRAAATRPRRGRLTAPMPGKVLAVLSRRRRRSKRGQLLMVLEAMKMEHAIAAPADGVVEAVHYAAGELVEEGALLLAFAGADGS